jgi:hypothetical protein
MKYEKAITCLKMLLLNAWLMNNGEYETLAYENMAMQYFHLNDSTRATYYHQRADHGILEPKNSTQRHMALEIRRQEKMLLGIKKKKVR